MSLGRWSALLGLVGFVVGALGSWRPSFWYDEAATVFSATRRMPDLLRLLQHQDAVHGLYYLGMHFWFRVFGAGEPAARLPSAIAVGVATAGVVLLGGRLASVRVGIASGVLFLVLPRVTWAAVEARDLALTAALAVWLTVLLLAAVRHNDIRWWLGYVLLAVVSSGGVSAVGAARRGARGDAEDGGANHVRCWCRLASPPLGVAGLDGAGGVVPAAAVGAGRVDSRRWARAR